MHSVLHCFPSVLQYQVSSSPLAHAPCATQPQGRARGSLGVTEWGEAEGDVEQDLDWVAEQEKWGPGFWWVVPLILLSREQVVVSPLCGPATVNSFCHIPALLPLANVPQMSSESLLIWHAGYNTIRKGDGPPKVLSQYLELFNPSHRVEQF